MSDVKLVAFILTCLLLLHGACMARCTGEIATQSILPPCHSHEPSDTNKTPVPSNTCTGSPALEGKSLTILPTFVVTILSETALVLASISDTSHQDTLSAAPPGTMSVPRSSVLRI